MISVINTWLTSLLDDADVPEARVFTDAAELAGNHPVPFAVLLVADEQVTRTGRRVGAEDSEDGTTRAVRWELFSRRLPVQLHLVLDSLATAESVVDAALAAAFTGPSDSGNRWKVYCRGVGWPEKRSRLATKVVVQLTFEFVSGVYRDCEIPLVTDVMPAPAT
jgi:hypothetical protein